MSRKRFIVAGLKAAQKQAAMLGVEWTTPVALIAQQAACVAAGEACDGNHAGAPCLDPECWAQPNPPAETRAFGEPTIQAQQWLPPLKDPAFPSGGTPEVWELHGTYDAPPRGEPCPPGCLIPATETHRHCPDCGRGYYQEAGRSCLPHKEKRNA